MKEIIEYLIGSLFLCYFFVNSCKLLFKSKIIKNFKSAITIIILMIALMLNYMFLDNMPRTAVAYITILVFNRTLFKKPILQCAIAAFVSYVLLALGELSFIACISIINLTGISIDIMDLSGSAFTNLIISLFSTLYLLLVYRPLSKIINKIKENNKIMLIITFTLFVVVNCMFFYKIYLRDYQFDKHLILNSALLIALSYIAFILIKQQYDKSRISDEYEKYVEYSRQSEKLVEKYCISQHENKNELIIIKSMVNKNNKALIEYLNEIISNKDNIDEAWIRPLRYLPFGGLKGIIHNKISEMKEIGINVFLDISKGISNCNLKKLTIKENNQLSKIIGVFLDNAKEAASLSNDKEVSVCAYIDQNSIVFEISNTYVEDIDISKIYNAGVSSKGKDRGYGLALVDSILSENKMFVNEVKKIDKYFVQILKINI